MVRDEIMDEVKVSEVFLVDKIRDLQKKGQISIVLRYYYGGTIYESFVCFGKAACYDADS